MGAAGADGFDVEVGRVGFNAEHIALLVDGVGVKFARWDQVETLRLRDGYLSPHPLLQIGFGIGLAASTAVPCAFLVGLLSDTGGSASGLAVGIFGLGLWMSALPLGLFLAWTALRKGPYLEVRTRSGLEKFPVGDALDPPQITEGIREVERRFGVACPVMD